MTTGVGNAAEADGTAAYNGHTIKQQPEQPTILFKSVGTNPIVQTFTAASLLILKAIICQLQSQESKVYQPSISMYIAVLNRKIKPVSS